MSILKNIFGRVFALWAVLVFVPTLMVVVIPIWLTNFIKEPRGTEIFRRISKLWMDVFLFMIGCPLKIKGRKNFVKGENYVVVSNHNSFMDVPITTPYIPGANKTIAKSEIAKTPLFGVVYKRGSILVDRKSEKSRKDSFGKMKEVLADGLHMCIYPEGTRNKTNEPLRPFHDGAFRLAISTGKSIMPTLLFNTRYVLPGGSKPFFLWPSKMHMDFLEPVPVLPGDTVQSLKERVFILMHDYFLAHAANYR